MKIRRSSGPHLRKLGAALMAVALVLAWSQAAVAQQTSGTLAPAEPGSWYWGPEGLKLLYPVIAGIAGGVFAILANRWLRMAATDQTIHAKRLETYPALVRAAARLALYFPADETGGTAPLDPDKCRAMGREMSKWYFDGGGLLLGRATRDAYFRFARALTRASQAKDLKVPHFPDDAEDISREMVAKYRTELKLDGLDLDNIEKWTFGGPSSSAQARTRKPYLEFKDYVFLQEFSSALRTALSEDLRSRRRPS